MGYFSEFASGEGAAERQEGFEGFALDANAIDGTAEVGESPVPDMEEFEDEDRQRAEAEAAPAVLAMLNQQTGGDEPGGEEPDGVAPEKTDEPQPTEDEKKKAHEESEAKRRAEWEAKQAAKKAADEKALQELAAMSEDELAAAAVKRTNDQSEVLTRRNMMMCVTEFVQTRCYEDPEFARLTMHPRKSMVNCFKYINQKAYERAKEEMDARGIQATQRDPYAAAIAADDCYEWAEAYFRDLDAKVDQGEDDEFVPKPYYGGTSKPKKAAAKPKQEKKKKPAEPPKKVPEEGQLSLLDGVPA